MSEGSEGTGAGSNSPSLQVRRWVGSDPDPQTPPASSSEQVPPTLPASYPRTLCLTETQQQTHSVVPTFPRMQLCPAC